MTCFKPIWTCNLALHSRQTVLDNIHELLRFTDTYMVLYIVSEKKQATRCLISAHFLTNHLVKEFWKHLQSYYQTSSGLLFSGCSVL